MNMNCFECVDYCVPWLLWTADFRLLCVSVLLFISYSIAMLSIQCNEEHNSKHCVRNYSDCRGGVCDRAVQRNDSGVCVCLRAHVCVR